MKTCISRRATKILFFLLSTTAAAYAVLRNHYSDSEVVARAELIVIAKVKEGSIVFHPAKPRPGYHIPGWDHTVELTVAETLKGNLTSNSIIVCLPGGLEPVVGRYSSNKFGAVFDGRTSNPPKGIIEVWDTATSVKSTLPISGDVRTNHIWLLRHSYPVLEADKTNSLANVVGVGDPEDIQPVSKRDEVLQYLK